MYNKQDFYEGQLQKLGLMDKDAFTCTCYMPEVGNKPEKGEILSWSESSAVVSRQLGARRALQPKFRDSGHHGLDRGLCSLLWSSDRR